MNACIAVPVEGEEIFAHFGKAQQFKIYTVEEGKVASTTLFDTEGRNHEDLALALVFNGVNAVVCGNIGPGAHGALVGAGIETLAGVAGKADEVIAQLLAGTLAPVESPTCGGHGGSCGGGHGCGGGCHGCHGCHHG